MVQTIENALDYMDENKIKPDLAVKKLLVPLIERQRAWCENESI